MNSATRTGEPRIRQEPARLVPAAAAPELHPVLDQYSRSQDQLSHMLPVCVTPRRRLTCRQSSGDSRTGRRRTLQWPRRPARSRVSDRTSGLSRSSIRAGSRTPATSTTPGPTSSPAAPPPQAGDAVAVETTPLRGASARVVTNMESSLDVPTATSVRAVPAKLLVDNRIVVNN